VPVTNALDGPMFDGGPVVAVGGVGAAEADDGAPVDVIATASAPQPTNSTAAAVRTLRMLPPFGSVDATTNRGRRL
jgi:hypothetical protein